MSNINVTQRNATRNQSTADYQRKKVFLFDNRYENGAYKNTTGASQTLLEGMFVARSTTIVGGLIPVTSANLADVIGIAAVDDAGGIVLANNAIVTITFATKGTVDGSELVMPATVTLDTIVGNKAFRDVLEGIGLHVENSAVENTKFDN